MAILREEIQAKIDAIEAKAEEDLAPLKAELLGGNAYLAEEWDSFKTRIESLLTKVRAAL